MLVTSSGSGQILIPQNALRKSLLIQNTDGTNAVYVKRESGPVIGVSASNFDFKIGPGGAVAINSLIDGLKAIQDSYTVISAAGTPVIAVFETEDIGR